MGEPPSDMPSTAPAAAEEHLGYVDGLRAVAVLGVVASHVTKHSPALYQSTLARVVAFGGHGVELFFVISGLCLAFPYLRKREARGTLGFDGATFFAKRTIRILPPYYACVVVLALASLSGVWQAAAAAPFGAGMTEGLTLRGLAAHAVFASREWEDLNRSFWTLRIEAIWYLLFPLVLVAYARNRAVFSGIGAACAAASLAHVFRAPFGTVDVLVTALPAFMLGIVAADRTLVRRVPAWAALALLVASCAVATAADLASLPWARLPWGVTAFTFVLLAGRVAPLRAALAIRPLALVGIASYSIYLVHEPLIAILEYVGTPALLAGAAGIAAGFAFWWAVERPVTRDPVRARLLAVTRRAIASAVPA